MRAFITYVRFGGLRVESILMQSRGLGKLRRQGATSWLKKELNWRLGTLLIFFRNKTFLFVKVES